jgi:hypothetical protein
MFSLHFLLPPTTTILLRQRIRLQKPSWYLHPNLLKKIFARHGKAVRRRLLKILLLLLLQL